MICRNPFNLLVVSEILILYLLFLLILNYVFINGNRFYYILTQTNSRVFFNTFSKCGC